MIPVTSLQERLLWSRYPDLFQYNLFTIVEDSAQLLTYPELVVLSEIYMMELNFRESVLNKIQVYEWLKNSVYEVPFLTKPEDITIMQEQPLSTQIEFSTLRNMQSIIDRLVCFNFVADLDYDFEITLPIGSPAVEMEVLPALPTELEIFDTNTFHREPIKSHHFSIQPNQDFVNVNTVDVIVEFTIPPPPVEDPEQQPREILNFLNNLLETMIENKSLMAMLKGVNELIKERDFRLYKNISTLKIKKSENNEVKIAKTLRELITLIIYDKLSDIDQIENVEIRSRLSKIKKLFLPGVNLKPIVFYEKIKNLKINLMPFSIKLNQAMGNQLTLLHYHLSKLKPMLDQLPPPAKRARLE